MADGARRNKVWHWASAAVLLFGVCLTLACALLVNERMSRASEEEFERACTALDASLDAHLRGALADMILASATVLSEDFVGQISDYLEGRAQRLGSVWQIGADGPMLCWSHPGRQPQGLPHPDEIVRAAARARALASPNAGSSRIVAVAPESLGTAVWLVAISPDNSEWMGELLLDPIVTIFRQQFDERAGLRSWLAIHDSVYPLIQPQRRARAGAWPDREVAMRDGILRLRYGAAPAFDAIASVRPAVLTPIFGLGSGFSLLLFLIMRALGESADRAERLQTLSFDLRRRDRELERGRAQAEAASAAKSEFLRRMSHNIRSPLTNILGNAELLLERSTPGSAERTSLRAIHASADHLLALANELLELARAESGQITVVREEADIASILEELLESFRSRVGGRRIELATRWRSPEPRSIRTDPTRLREIITNLLDNAVRHTEHGRVMIEASIDRVTNRLRLAVSDTGCGIPEDVLPRVFEPSEPGEHGAGLGLNITKHLVAALGGDIRASSVPGEGSTFTVDLPVSSIRMPADAPGLPPTSSARALVVDDAAEVRSFMRVLLGRRGITTVEAGSLAEARSALRAAGAGSLSLVFLDIQLPDGRGTECLAEIRAAQPASRIVALTGDVGPDSERRYIEAGFDAFLPKPFDERHFDAAIGGGPRAERAA